MRATWGGRAVLVLIGIRLGIDGVNPIYYETIKVRSSTWSTGEMSDICSRHSLLSRKVWASPAVALLPHTISWAHKLTLSSISIPITFDPLYLSAQPRHMISNVKQLQIRGGPGRPTTARPPRLRACALGARRSHITHHCHHPHCSTSSVHPRVRPNQALLAPTRQPGRMQPCMYH